MLTGEHLMYAFLDHMLPLSHVDHLRPDWLRNPVTGCNLELDRYYPTLKVGFEFQGDQHFRDTDLDSGGTQARDKIKKQLCREAGVIVIQVRAIDLEWTHLNGKIKYAIARAYKGKAKPKFKHDRRIVNGLNVQATAYRAYLRERFPGTMTARTERVARKARLTPWRDCGR